MSGVGARKHHRSIVGGNAMKPSPALLHTLSLTEEQLLTYLDMPEPGPPADAVNRKHTRSPYRVDDGIIVELLNQSYPQDCARVAPRDLSAGGIGFLHRGSLPGGTPVAVHFPLCEGRMHSATGRVVRCFGLTKDVYDVGVAFDKPIDLESILAVRHQLDVDS
jgi:hypothetical protein